MMASQVQQPEASLEKSNFFHLSGTIRTRLLPPKNPHSLPFCLLHAVFFGVVFAKWVMHNMVIIFAGA